MATAVAAKHQYLCTNKKCEEPLHFSPEQLKFLEEGCEVPVFCQGKDCDLVYHIGPKGIMQSYHNIDPHE